MARSSTKKSPSGRKGKQGGTPKAAKPQAANASHSADAPANVQSTARSRSVLLFFFAAIMVAAGWGLFLGTTALFTANPVTLNRLQIEQSDFVVTATVTDLKTGSVQVSREWKRGATPGEIRIGNLSETGVESGRAYILPLSRPAGGEYRVTRSRLPNQAPLVYPDTPEANEQLTEILGRPKRPSVE